VDLIPQVDRDRPSPAADGFDQIPHGGSAAFPNDAAQTSRKAASNTA
jgi:hypothetical protein